MIDDRHWKIVQKRLGYNEQEMEAFRADPRNEDVLSRSGDLIKTRFIAEIVHSHGCNSRHKVGEKIYFDGYGNLLKELSPDRLCIFALSAISPLIFAAHELVYAGIDPNEMRFRSAGCMDVGVNCGGWGKVVLKMTAEKT